MPMIETYDPPAYVINRSVDSDEAEVLIYDVIGPSWFEETVTAKQFVNDLKAIGDVRTLNVRINSPGGSVYDGLAIYNALKRHPAKVVVHVDGMAASMASVIAMAGEQVNMAENAVMMVHNPQAIVSGDARELRKLAEHLDAHKRTLVNVYRGKTKQTVERLNAMLDEETWMTADEAFENGFADQITEEVSIAANFQLPQGFRVPEAYRESVQAVLSVSNKGVTMTTQAPQATLQPAAPQPATLEQLEALAGADEKFVIAQLKAKATLPDAIGALNAQLNQKLAEANAKLSQQATQPAASAVSPPVVPAAPAAVAQTPPAAPVTATTSHPQTITATLVGVQPVVSTAAPTGGAASAEQPYAKDPVAFLRNETRLRRQKGMTTDAAFTDVYNTFPGLKEAFAAIR